MKIRKVARYKKEKKEVDKLMYLLNSYKESQVPYIEKMNMLINIDDMYIERLNRNFNRYGGLNYYSSFEEYINVVVVPYLLKRNIRIGDLK